MVLSAQLNIKKIKSENKMALIEYSKYPKGEAVLLKEIKIPVLLKHLGIESVDSFVDTAYNGKLLQLRISNNDYFDYNSDKNGNAIDLVMFLKDIDRKKAKIELIKFLEEIDFDFMNTLQP